MRQLCFLFTIIFLAAMTSCATMDVTLNVLEPADISIPSNIQKMAVVNRSLPDKDEKAKNVVEGILTGEAPFADRAGSAECLRGVADALVQSPRFTIFVPREPNLKGTGTRKFPAPLDWNVIDDICRKTGADAVLSLEIFDSNNRINYHLEQRSKTILGKEMKYMANVGLLRSSIEAGWRVYNPSTRQIVDENVFTDYREWNAEGESEKLAFGRLPAQTEAVKMAGYFAGEQYAKRISPNRVRVGREFYKKGNSDMKYAKRLCQSGRWDEAADVWKKYTEAPKAKLAGRACYNMALAEEINGNLQAALDWSDKAFVRYNIKNARTYSNILKWRINQQHRLDEQMTPAP